MGGQRTLPQRRGETDTIEMRVQNVVRSPSKSVST